MRSVLPLLGLLLPFCPQAGGRTPPDSPPRSSSTAAPSRIFYFDGGSGLPGINSVGHDGRKVPKPLRSVPLAVGFQPYTARVDPTGRRLAYGAAELRNHGIYPPSRIFGFDLTGVNKPELLVELAGVELNHWLWSADGKRLVITSWDAKHQTRNWVADLATKQVRELKLPTLPRKEGGDIRLHVVDESPDGGELLVLGDGLHRIKHDGTGREQLSKLEDLTDAHFSPDGKQVLMVTEAKGRGGAVHVLDRATGKARTVAEGLNFTDVQARWSPDGKHIAYAVTFLDGGGERGQETNLNVVDADGRNGETLVRVMHESRAVGLTLFDWR